jgi:hypothetical protein
MKEPTCLINPKVNASIRLNNHKVAVVVLDAKGIRTDRRIWFQSQYAFVKGTGAAHVANGAANEGDLFDLDCSLANQVISRNRGRTLPFA